MNILKIRSDGYNIIEGVTGSFNIQLSYNQRKFGYRHVTGVSVTTESILEWSWCIQRPSLVAHIQRPSHVAHIQETGTCIYPDPEWSGGKVMTSSHYTKHFNVLIDQIIME